MNPIRHLTSREPFSFGGILEEKPNLPDAVIRHAELKKSRVLTKYRCAAPVVLDYVSGMPLLILYDKQDIHIFYLDRILLLNAGVEFSLAPMEEDSCVEIQTEPNAPLETVEKVPLELLPGHVPILPLGRIFTFFRQQAPRPFYFRGEQHAPYELVCMFHGRMHNLVDGQDILLSPQEVMIINRNSWHMQYSDAQVSFLTISFHVDGDVLDGIVNARLTLPPAARRAIDDMLREEAHQLTFSGDYQRSLLKICLIELLRDSYAERRKSSASFPTTVRSENRIVDLALQEITRNVRKKYTLPMLARSVNVSVPYLSQLFFKHLGMPPGKYIIKIRLEESKALLRDGALSIGEVATQMGYSSVQHFSQQFRQWFGHCPSEYLQSL